MDPIFADIASWWDWLVARWSVTETPPTWALATVTVILAAACAYRPTWIVLRHGVTIIHEMGHVIMALFWGRRIQGVKLHTDTSGLTISSGKPRGPGVLFTYLAGYTAPPAVGLALIWASLSGWSGAAMTLLCALLIAALWLSANLFGFITISIALAGALTALWYNDPLTITVGTTAVGIFMLIAAFRGGFDLWATHRAGDGDSSDAAMAARHSLLPTMFWVWAFAAFSAFCALKAAQIIYTALV